jgi:hypothetical protein
MKPNPPDPAVEGALPSTVSQAAPLDIIRTEAVLSKFPVHNLSKKGRVNIQISSKGPNGQTELQWDVSYSERHGQARQLAYKLDTIVVDRVIDEASKPLPERLKIGSLCEIAEQLGIFDGGRALDSIKRAFHQNAGAYIIAGFKYRANDGTEKLLEAGFTRYSVVFTGEKFADGSKADAVYIILNQPYREVLNNAPFRPLDLEYKKQLSPTAQRFYEIVSYKIFTAIKYRRPYAKLAYSEYCTFSAQQRYFDYDHFKKQMYKIHRPHLASGYIAKVSHNEAKDEQGKADWTMCYVPGPKALAEYDRYHSTRKETRGDDAAHPCLPAEKSAPANSPRRPPPLRPAPATELPPQAAVDIDPQILAELAQRGIGEIDARQLLGSLPPDQCVMDLLEYGDYLINQKRSRIENPPGFYISLLQRTVPVPASFVSSRKAREKQAAIQAERLARLEQQEAKLRAEEEERNRLNARISALPEGLRQALFHQAKIQILAGQPGMAHFFKTNLDAIHDPLVLRKMGQILDQWLETTAAR